MASRYKRSCDEPRTIAIPDWQLLYDIEELLAEYQLPMQREPFMATDSRGDHYAATVDALRTEVEERGQPIEAMHVGYSTADGAVYELRLRARNSMAAAHGPVESFVVDTVRRTEEALDRAATRFADSSKPPVPPPRQDSGPSLLSRITSHPLGSTVIGGLILAAIIYAIAQAV